jgi:hypothetical protein
MVEAYISLVPPDLDHLKGLRHDGCRHAIVARLLNDILREYAVAVHFESVKLHAVPSLCHRDNRQNHHHLRKVHPWKGLEGAELPAEREPLVFRSEDPFRTLIDRRMIASADGLKNESLEGLVVVEANVSPTAITTGECQRYCKDSKQDRTATGKEGENS